jgi:hypothetical protein
MDPVLAYIDVGSGSLIIQAVIAGLVAAPFVFRTQTARLIAKVRGVKPDAATNEPVATPEPAPAVAAATVADADTSG